MPQKKDSRGEHIPIWGAKPLSVIHPMVTGLDKIDPPTFSGQRTSGKNSQVSTTNGNEAICCVFIQFMRRLASTVITALLFYCGAPHIVYSQNKMGLKTSLGNLSFWESDKIIDYDKGYDLAWVEASAKLVYFSNAENLAAISYIASVTNRLITWGALKKVSPKNEQL